MALKRRSREEAEKAASNCEKQVSERAEVQREERIHMDEDTLLVSTGSTLLDLAISGGRVRGGGIPGGIMAEIFGPNSAGKTAILSELAASVQFAGGEVMLADPEARMDMEYARIYGVEIDNDNYFRPDTVPEVFDKLKEWDPDTEGKINLFGADSIAALSTQMEMEEGDKRGQRKAKELHEGCRVTARKIAKNNKLVFFTNQERDGDYGPSTSGGKAIGFYSSLRIRIKQKSKITKKKKISGMKDQEKVIGMHSECTIIKSTVDDPFRSAPVYIVFGVGIDDIRANLQYVKDMRKLSKYWCVDTDYVSMDKAIEYIEKNNLEVELREEVIDIWEEIEEAFKTERKSKKRF